MGTKNASDSSTIRLVLTGALMFAGACLEAQPNRSNSGGKGGSAADGTGGSQTGGSGSPRNTGGTAGGSGGRGGGGGGGGGGGTGGSVDPGTGGASGGTGGAGGSSSAPFSFMSSYGTADGFKGYWYTFKDAAGSTISPDCGPMGTCFMGATSVCVAGSAAKVEMMMYATYWGAGVGWNLNQGIMAPNPAMGASLAGKTSVTVNLDMKVMSPVRLKFKIAGDPSDYCTNVTGGSNTVPFSMINKDCWTGLPGPMPEGAMVESMQLQVPSSEVAAIPFDFCVSNVAFK